MSQFQRGAIGTTLLCVANQIPDTSWWQGAVGFAAGVFFGMLLWHFFVYGERK